MGALVQRNGQTGVRAAAQELTSQERAMVVCISVCVVCACVLSVWATVSALKNTQA